MITKQQFKEKILPVVLKHEGGYALVKGDNGGETYRGIARQSNPDWPGWPLLEKYKPLRNGDLINDAALQTAVCELYWQKYFEANGFHRCNNPIVALQLFDFSVHGGYSTKQLQRTMNRMFNQSLKEDGDWGEKTIAGINSIRPDLLCNAILNDRAERLRQIIERDPTQEKFRKGWTNRINAMRYLIRGIAV